MKRGTNRFTKIDVEISTSTPTVAEAAALLNVSPASVVNARKVLQDGRNRYVACERAGVEPRFRTYDGDDLIKFVVSLNLHRRHLSETQRAMVAAQIANMRRGHRTDLDEISTRSVSVGRPPRARTDHSR